MREKIERVLLLATSEWAVTRLNAQYTLWVKETPVALAYQLVSEYGTVVCEGSGLGANYRIVKRLLVALG